MTVSTFAVPTAVCGMWVLPSLVDDAATRWGVASALGATVAALAVLWGQSFATSDSGQGVSGPPSGMSVEASGLRAVAVGGSVRGNISTGDTGTGAQHTAGAGGSTGRASQPGTRAGQAPVTGSVVASGERSAAVGDGVEGDIITGDQAVEPRP
ncbi:hypothetical protein [Kitasatospora sp. NPDC005856]|uniref:hypothetical protein n=1 Tax=Kitasatospora sp. NPDC005856 TaxID=3154566 RepID=UPI0033F42D8D